MRILSKNGNDLVLLAMNNEVVHKGDYLVVDDQKLNQRMIIQIYEFDYLSSQGLIEDIVKEEMLLVSSHENVLDPLNISSLSKLVRDAKLIRTKIRSSIDMAGKISNNISWIPSRVYSQVRKLSLFELGDLLNRSGLKPINIGLNGKTGENFQIYAEDLDGR